jgi:hypothetical protein
LLTGGFHFDLFDTETRLNGLGLIDWLNGEVCWLLQKAVIGVSICLDGALVVMRSFPAEDDLSILPSDADVLVVALPAIVLPLLLLKMAAH